MDQAIYNCHTHIFTNEDVPEDFLPWKLVWVLRNFRLVPRLSYVLKRIIPFIDNDLFDRFAATLDISDQRSQREVFETLMGFYPEGARFVVLAMDMEYMGAGDARSYRDQLDELALVREHYPDRLLPFVCADPRRHHILDIVKTYIEQRHFHGIKIYPPLGYYPFDDNLYPVYEYAQTNEIPILTHCSPGGLYFKGRITKDMFAHPKTGLLLERKPNKAFAANFSHPDNYVHVLKDFPNLKICLAHFGGEEEWNNYLINPWDSGRTQHSSWFRIILNMIKTYPNLYTDISYTLHDPEFYPLLKVVMLDNAARHKILFGSDFYVVQIDRAERAFSLGVRTALGEADFTLIAHTNPKAFLDSKIWPI